MSKKLLSVLVILLLVASSAIQAKDYRALRTHKVSDGSEQYDNTSGYSVTPTRLVIPPYQSSSLTFVLSPTPTATVYDLQSNAVPQEIWQDPITPSNVHAVFMYSTVAGFATRACAYLFSNDFGATWNFLGDVPGTGRSGFPGINGLTNGAAVVINHNNTNGTSTHGKINYDQGAGFGVFTEIDPGVSPDGDPIWGKIVGLPNNNLVFAASINGAVFSYTNKATNIAPPGTFSGYQTFPGDQAETYSLALAPNGTVGHAFIGSDNEDPNDVFYRSSADGGLTWTAKQKIWDWNEATDSLGCLRGVSMAFGNNNQPYVAFNTSVLTLTGFFPGLPSQIRVWSPGVNGGVAKVIANDATVPFFPNEGSVSDAYLPICRPAIGRASTGDQLFCAFVATTNQIGTDTSRYYAGWFSYTNNSGNTWSTPERMTPPTPRRDYRFVSISPTSNRTGNGTKVQMFIQSDSLAGTHVNGAPIGNGYGVGITTDVTTGINTVSSVVPGDFSLYQNFPNPFNPTTSIRFDIKKSANVTLKVYNAQGKEVATLVNNEVVSPGTKEVSFGASNLTSGIYFYTLSAGDFRETKKMMLIK
jgi:hypothetical protein